jgi:TonB family protein
MATQASDSIKARSRGTSVDELAVIVQRAQAFTNASGAAIAVGEGNTDEIVCRARSGSSAPDVGTALRVEGSFTGVCIQSGKELRCDDAETDTRVDTAAIRALGIRSMVITPIKEEGKVVGVLAVFAPTPHAFTITHVAVLKTMADQIASLLQKERRAKEEGHFEPLVTMPKPAASAAPLPPPVVIKPGSVSSGGNGAAAAPARALTATLPKVEPIRPVPVAADIAPPVTLPKRSEEKQREKRPEFKPFDYRAPELKSEPASATSRANLGTLDAVSGEHKPAGMNKMILVGALVAVLAVAGAIFGFLKTRHSSSPAQAQETHQPPQNSTPAQPTTTAVNNPVTTPASTPPQPVTTAKPEKENKRNESESRRSESQRGEQPSKTTTIALSDGNSRLSAAAAPQNQPQEVAPSLSVGSGSSDLGSLVRPVDTPKPAMVAQSNLANAAVLHTVPAVYPEIAKSRHLSGAVVLKVMIGKDGKVSSPRFISGPVIFRDAAFDAVKQWTFKPAMLNGQAIEQETQITINFKP